MKINKNTVKQTQTFKPAAKSQTFKPGTKGGCRCQNATVEDVTFEKVHTVGQLREVLRGFPDCRGLYPTINVEMNPEADKVTGERELKLTPEGFCVSEAAVVDLINEDYKHLMNACLEFLGTTNKKELEALRSDFLIVMSTSNNTTLHEDCGAMVKFINSVLSQLS